jgi:hypothetical protein
VTISSRLQPYPSLNYANFMSGRPYIQSPVKVLIEKPLPLTTFMVLAAVTIGFIACAVGVTRQQDF